ncbi:MAG: HDOD domain-containing protein [Terriglobales bacterium]
MATGTSNAVQPPDLRWDTDSIPPFPAIALKALKMMARTDTSLLELCNLIRSDQAFSAAILKIANSPLVGFPKSITSVVQASMLLGFGRLRSVAVTVGLKAYFNNSFTPLMKSCWRHSIACAIIAERSAKSRFLDNEFAYTAGILHDIGRVALAMTMPAAYSDVLHRGAEQPQDLLLLERELCGIDHCEAGRSLVAAWNLPDAFLQVAACHHSPQAPARSTASLLPPSCALADSLGFGVVQFRSPRTYANVLADFPDPARTQFPTEAEQFASDIEHEIQVIESA